MAKSCYFLQRLRQGLYPQAVHCCWECTSSLSHAAYAFLLSYMLSLPTHSNTGDINAVHLLDRILEESGLPSLFPCLKSLQKSRTCLSQTKFSMIYKLQLPIVAVGHLRPAILNLPWLEVPSWQLRAVWFFAGIVEEVNTQFPTACMYSQRYHSGYYVGISATQSDGQWLSSYG